jgi:Transcriptional antiterminator
MVYRYKRTLNNNAIVGIDEDEHEVILLGKSIGIRCIRNPLFKVSPCLIEKVFSAVKQENQSYYEELIKSIPFQYFSCVDHVVEQAGRELNYDFKDQLTLTLLDHIHYSKQRLDKGQVIQNPLLKEIQQFYPAEYKAAENTVRYLNKNLNTAFDENEISFIAFHFVNAMSTLPQSTTKKIAIILKKCTEIIENYYEITLDTSSYYYIRFTTHVKYFLTRVFNNEKNNEGGESQLSDIIHQQYKNEWLCAEKIKMYLMDEYKVKTSNEELAYLTLHISTMLKNNGRR